LLEKIKEIDWRQAAKDVAPFLSYAEQQSLELWSSRFFSGRMAKLT